jgi:hypothetical protein
MSMYDAQEQLDDKLAGIAEETQFEVPTVHDVAEHVGHLTEDEQVTMLVRITGRPKDEVSRLVRMVQTAVLDR